MKTRKNRYLLPLLLPAIAFATWEKIDDFEYENPADMWNTWFIAGQVGFIAIADIIEDPADKDNKALHFDINAYQMDVHTLTAMLPKAETRIPDGTEATFYWRWFMAGHDTSPVIGFSLDEYEWMEPGAEGNDTERPWSDVIVNWDYRTVILPNPTWRRDQHIDIYDNNRYEIAYTFPGELFEFPAGQWFEFWKHVVNAPGASGADEYSVYARPLGGDQVRLIIGSSTPDLFFDTALFRGQLNGDLLRFRLVSYTGARNARYAGDMVLYDDFYIDYSGLNLTTPEGVRLPDTILEFWNGLPLVRIGEAEWVESPLLKWLGVDFDPWIWSDALSTWVYLPEYKGSGSWMYVMPSPGEPPSGTGETWNGLPVVTLGDGSSWVESPLLDWVMVNHDPFLWSSTFSTWLYLPEYNAAGTWVYVLPGA